MIHPWEHKSTTPTLDRKPFRILDKVYLKPDGVTSFTANVIHCPDWVNIIAVNSAGDILLERQFRFGTDTIETEIPGGVIEPNESPALAAARELEEETGYISPAWQQIGVVKANPAIMQNRCFTFLARDIQGTGATHWDVDEDIEYFFASEAEVKQMLRSGEISNAYVVAAFAWYFGGKDMFSSKSK